MLTVGSLFSGIGGLELGLEGAGLGPVLWQVEKDPFCRRVLAKHWPSVERFEDVCAVGAAQLAPVDLICGGFPCQDISSAGKGAGLAGERSGLWREFARIVCEVRPSWVVVENVASGARRWVDAVCGELGQLGYETLPVPLSAEDVGAPYERARVFIVARAHGNGKHPVALNGEVGPAPGTVRVPDGAWEAPDVDGKQLRIKPWRIGREDGSGSIQHTDVGQTADPESARLQGAGLRRLSTECPWAEDSMPEPSLGRMVSRVPHRVDRIAALGNCVVPQCAEVIGWVIRELM